MSSYQRKSWHEKLHDTKGLPQVVTINDKMQKRWGTKAGDTCVIPAPREVDALMKQVRKGKLITINELRAALAKKHRATLACPLTTGIFAWIAAHAAAEADAKGQRKITPYWRTLKNGGELNPKFPGGSTALARLLRAEGHSITRKGSRYLIVNFEKSLAQLH